ncbi:MAG: hypothetical protein SchgKO_10490 [Schleiferiaceae bacterium]
MNPKPIITIFLICILGMIGCDDHNRRVMVLDVDKTDADVIYQTSKADFYFEKGELLNYCIKNSEEEKNGEGNGFIYQKIIDYINTYEGNPILIPDTLGTMMSAEQVAILPDTINAVRVWDSNHPYAYVTEEIRWAVIDFAKSGNLRIFYHQTAAFMDSVNVEEIDTEGYGLTQITGMNDSIVFSQLRWIQ